MSKKPPSSHTIQVKVGGDMQGNLAIGDQNVQQQTIGASPAPTEAELAEIRKLFTELRARVEAEAPADKKAAAKERVDELEKAVNDKKPDLSTMEYVKNWFTKNLPALAGAVTSIVLNPFVGILVKGAGELVVDEFKRRFGTG